MGRRGDRTVNTYGRHRQRVISSEVWNNVVGRKATERHVFSTSSSMDSLSLSHNSSGDSIFQPRKTAISSRNKENPTRLLRNRQMKMLDSSSGLSGSSTSNTSEGLFKANSRPRRALRDRSNLKDERQVKSYGKRKRVQNISSLHHYSLCKNATSASSGSSLYNFSEFDDYSLVISGTPGQINDKNVSQDNAAFCSPCALRSGKKLQIETSTPFAKRFQPGTPLSEKIKDTDLSDIAIVDSPILPKDDDCRENLEESCTDLDRLGISSIVEQSREQVTPLSGQSSLNTRPTSGDSRSKNSPADMCLVQLERLRESFLSLHVSTRTRSKEPVDVVDNSKSLFSDISLVSLHTDESTSGEDSHEDKNSSEDNSSEDNSSAELSDINENEEEEEENSSESSNENSKESTNCPHNNSTHYMLTDGSYLQEPEVESLHSSYQTAGSGEDSTGQSYHTADSSPLPSHVSSQRKGKTKLDNLDEVSVFDVLTPKKCVSPVVEDSPRTKVFQVCQQTSPVPFRVSIPDRMMRVCTKVGEGVYGEVFRTQNNGKSVAVKVIPIEGSFPVNDEPQKTFSEMLPEIVISKELSSLRSYKDSFAPNFCQVNKVSCVQGQYPAKLLKEWEVFDDKGRSQNDKPDMFDDLQLFIVFEFADGGRDLETCQFQNIFEARSALSQVAFSLAVGEEALEFEHRDLHWGNVLIKRTEAPEIHYRLMDNDYSITSHRVDACLIDFTLSRLKKDGCVVYNDLSKDESLFEGTGDLQFDIYRQMKDINNNDWEPFHPRTNVLWLHYLADKLVRSKRYIRNSREDKSLLREFRTFLKDILEYSSACELVTCNDFLRS